MVNDPLQIISPSRDKLEIMKSIYDACPQERRERIDAFYPDWSKMEHKNLYPLFTEPIDYVIEHAMNIFFGAINPDEEISDEGVITWTLY